MHFANSSSLMKTLYAIPMIPLNARGAKMGGKSSRPRRFFTVMQARTLMQNLLILWSLTKLVNRWNHFTNAELKNNHDDLLRAECGLPEVSFAFQYISHWNAGTYAWSSRHKLAPLLSSATSLVRRIAPFSWPWLYIGLSNQHCYN